MARKSNFGVSVIATAPAPATTGDELVVNAGDGANFPVVPFYATVWPADEIASLDNAEVVLVTDKDDDTFTITRAQKGTTAQTIVTGMAIANAIYAEDLQGGAGYIFVAANNSTDEDKAKANYVCDGVADDVQIQAAIDDVIADGGKVVLARGEYFCTATLEIDGLLSSLPNPSEQAFTIILHGTGNQGTDLYFDEDVDGILLTGTPMVDIQGIRLFISGTADGFRSVITTGSYRGFWNSSFKNISIIGDFDLHSGWAMDLDGPFRSTFENIEANGVGNGIRLSATNGAFNPGNCVFLRCFLDLGAAPNGTAYSLYTPDDGGSFNIMTFIQCEAIDGAESTTSKGWHLRGSSTTFYSSKNIRIIQSNMEDFNTAVLLEHAEDNFIEMSWSNAKDAGTLYEIDASSSGNELYCLTSYVGPAKTMTFVDDNNVTADRPNVVGKSTVYVDTGATLTADLGTDTVLKEMRVWGPGTWDAALDGYWMPANQLGAVKITGTPAAGEVLKATSATAATWEAESGGGGSVDTANTPAAGEFAKFTDANTIEGRTAAELKADLDLEVGVDIQAYDADLATWAGVSSSANGRSLVSAADYAAMRTLLGLVIGTNVQAYDADLTTWAGLTPSANAQSLVTAADYAAMKTLLGLGTADSPQFTGVNVGNATDTTVTRSAAGILAVEGVAIPTISNTATLTNKRITPRVNSIAGTTSPQAPTADTIDLWAHTAMSTAMTFSAPTGTPTNGQRLMIRLKDNGTARALTWNAIYRSMGATLPTTTTVNKTMYLGFIYNSADTTWDLIALAQQA